MQAFDQHFTDATALRVGMTGLGNMGMPMALNLLGVGVARSVGVYARSPEKLAPACEVGAGYGAGDRRGQRPGPSAGHRGLL